MDVLAIDEYYEENSVYKALVVCDSDEAAVELTDTLKSKDYSVVLVTEDDLESERPRHLQCIRDFQVSMDRMLVVSQYVFRDIFIYIQAYVLPHQNLIIFYNLDYNLLRLTTLKYLLESKSRGFLDEDVNILNT